MMLTQTSDADPFIVCAIPDHPGDLAPRTIEAAYEDDAHYLGTLPAEYHLDIEQRELTKHPPAVDQVNDLLATLGFAPVQPFMAIAWTNRHEQPVVLMVAQQSRLSIAQCDHGLRQTITRRPFRGPVAHPGDPAAHEGHTEFEHCARCGALRVVGAGSFGEASDRHLGAKWTPEAPRGSNRWSPSCLNRPAQRTHYFHGLVGGVTRFPVVDMAISSCQAFQLNNHSPCPKLLFWWYPRLNPPHSNHPSKPTSSSEGTFLTSALFSATGHRSPLPSRGHTPLRTTFCNRLAAPWLPLLPRCRAPASALYLQVFRLPLPSTAPKLHTYSVTGSRMAFGP